ncbi:tRNA1(Val) (adenine(37)-N6)-methyltransferase [Pseudooceanicola onchidii]|uniref:tRNA1(Val) (adenine(37)-N6)-methyltransferase n=1 Tax=Pseudooceanicola onchidii TaxID=2562279 RepID=UPI0010AAF8F6|nr:methyltransferase [Pseudooceanicola onchidii]
MTETPVTLDRILGGRVALWQPKAGYRAGVDPVFLAASVPARTGQSVLDLGCGAGAAALCLGARVPGLRLVGLERQALYADLARRNAGENGQDFEVIEGDLADMPTKLKQRQFDHVIANPPYFRRDQSVAAGNAAREGAHGEDVPLSEWVAVAARRCAPRGYVSFIQRIERLPDLLTAFTSCLGSVELFPLIPREGRDPQLFLLRGRKNGRAAFRLLPGLVVHDGAAHDTDQEDYTPEATGILRDGMPINMG